jgi:hypothetical protein
MTFSDKTHAPETIAKLAREVDHTGDYTLSVLHLSELIRLYGNVRYAEGQANSRGGGGYE